MGAALGKGLRPWITLALTCSLFVLRTRSVANVTALPQTSQCGTTPFALINVRFWHKADIRCGAMQCPLSGVKRTLVGGSRCLLYPPIADILLLQSVPIRE